MRLLAVHETADDRLAEEHDAKQTLAALEEVGPKAPEFAQLLNQRRIDVLDQRQQGRVV